MPTQFWFLLIMCCDEKGGRRCAHPTKRSSSVGRTIIIDPLLPTIVLTVNVTPAIEQEPAVPRDFGSLFPPLLVRTISSAPSCPSSIDNRVLSLPRTPAYLTYSVHQSRTGSLPFLIKSIYANLPLLRMATVSLYSVLAENVQVSHPVVSIY